MAKEKNEFWDDFDMTFDELEMKLENEAYQMESCDWCDGKPVVYEDEAYALCERCREQMFGD